MPPSVLPTVATSSTGQNRSALALTTANTAGSEPIGINVAETRLTKNTEVSPTAGAESNARSHWIADRIIRCRDAFWLVKLLVTQAARAIPMGSPVKGRPL